jgi:TonB family protein
MFRTSVYEMDLRTRSVKLLYGGPARYRGREASYFGLPELDESHNMLFLVSKEYATEGALIAIRLANGQVDLISERVVGYDIIQCTKYRGDIIALKRLEDIFGYPYHLYWLYSSSGKELGLAGGENLDVETLRHGACEETAAAAVPSSPQSARASSIRMDESETKDLLMVHVDPAYPPQAQSEHIQGDVRLQVQIGADGAVQSIRLVSGPPQLVGAAIAAVKQWKYRPDHFFRPCCSG